MKNRIFTLLLLFAVRLLVNVFTCLQYTEGAKYHVVGNIVKTNQSISHCVYEINRYYFEIEGYCDFSRQSKISVFGRYDRRLIDVLLGKIYLSEALIDNKGELINGMPVAIGVGKYFALFRENIVANYYRYLPNNEAGLVAGIVLGDKKGISGDLYQKMVNSGTIHIAVASGYNLMLVGGSVLAVAFWVLSRAKATALAIVIMFVYSLLSGAEPPVIRALVMASLVFLGQCFGRGQMSWWALLLTVWLMLLFEPALIISVSFQLSVMASVGLMVVEPAIKRYIDIYNSRLLQMASSVGITTTLSTLLLTAPIIWFHFGRFGFIGILSNTLVLPFVPVLMILGGLMLITGGLLQVPVYAIAHLLIQIISYLGSGS